MIPEQASAFISTLNMLFLSGIISREEFRNTFKTIPFYGNVLVKELYGIIQTTVEESSAIVANLHTIFVSGVITKEELRNALNYIPCYYYVCTEDRVEADSRLIS
jgi:hypothetical protein